MLAAPGVKPQKTLYDYFPSRSCAVAYQWATGGVWTRNKQVGHQVISGLKEELELWKRVPPNQVDAYMLSMYNAYAEEALAPRTLTTTRQLRQASSCGEHGGCPERQVKSPTAR